MLDLPSFEQLDPEQDVILELPLDGTHLVVGPPGSGKTVMAIYRAQMLAVKKLPTLLLMYNKLLQQFTDASVRKMGIDGQVRTYHSWFPSFFKATYGCEPPSVDRWTIDWKGCWEIILSKGAPKAGSLHALVDEGQDMPPDFYSVMRMIAPTVCVFADENQQITEHHSTVREIQGVLGLDEVHQLRRNHRNTRRIAEVAAHFYAGLPSGIPDMPGEDNLGEVPLLVHRTELHQIIDVIVNFTKAHPSWHIGVLLPATEQQKQFYNRLNGKVPGVHVGLYSSVNALKKKAQPVKFDQPGISIVNHRSAKGLTFDAVFLPELQDWSIDTSTIEFRRRMYVLCSRARHELMFMYRGEGRPPVVEALPTHLLEEL